MFIIIIHLYITWKICKKNTEKLVTLSLNVLKLQLFFYSVHIPVRVFQFPNHHWCRFYQHSLETFHRPIITYNLIESFLYFKSRRCFLWIIHQASDCSSDIMCLEFHGKISLRTGDFTLKFPANVLYVFQLVSSLQRTRCGVIREDTSDWWFRLI